MSMVEKPLHSDIPVSIAEVKVLTASLLPSFEGDLRLLVFTFQLIETDTADCERQGFR